MSKVPHFEALGIPVRCGPGTHPPGPPAAASCFLQCFLGQIVRSVSLEMGNCFTSEPQECVQCIVKVRDQETQTQRRPDRRTLGMPRNEANEKRAERYRERKGLAFQSVIISNFQSQLVQETWGTHAQPQGTNIVLIAV